MTQGTIAGDGPEGNREFLARIEELSQENARLKAQLEGFRSEHELAERWRGLFEMANFGLTRVRLSDNTFTEVNATYAAKRGYTPEEMVGMSVYEVHPPELRERVAAQVRELDATGRLIFESEHQRKDGSRFPVLMEIVLLKDPQGRPVSRLAYSFDLTPLKKAQEGQTQHEALYRSLFEYSQDAILFTTVGGGVVRANPAAQAMFGMTEEAIIAAGEGVLLAPGQGGLDGLRRERAHKGWVQGKIRLRRGDGSIFVAEFSSALLPGLVEGFESCVILRDVTAREEMETEFKANREFLRETQRIARLGGWQVNPELDYLSWTEGVNWILEAPEGFTPTYEQGLLYFVESYRDRVREAIAEAYHTGEPRRLECELTTARGRRIWCAISAIRVTDLAGIRSVMGAIQDITSRKAYERDLISANIAAVSANRIKTEFLANMSHELRTPLNGIMGMLQLCQCSSLPRDVAEYVGLAYDCSHNLLDIINNILVITQAEEESSQRCSSRFDPAAMVREALASFAARRPNPEVDLELTLHLGDLPGHVYGDSFRIRQVLANVLDNAHKFTERGTVFVTVTSLRQPGDLARARLLFEVTDPGIGIEPKDLDYIFEKFTQVDAANTRRFGGMGVGLAIVKRLLPLVGGTACVDSSPGLGTSFLFTAEVGLFESWAGPAAGTGRQAGSRYSSLRILLVEDDLTNQLTIRTMLEKIGHRGVVADSGDKVLEALDQSRFDMVLLDIQMPGLSGLEVASRIRASGGKHARIPIIAVSADTSPTNRQACLGVGMNAFLPKPLDLHDLAREIDRCRT